MQGSHIETSNDAARNLEICATLVWTLLDTYWIFSPRPEA